MELNNALKNEDPKKVVTDFFKAACNRYSDLAPLFYLVEFPQKNTNGTLSLPIFHIDVPAHGYHGLRMSFSKFSGDTHGGNMNKQLIARDKLWKQMGYKHFRGNHLLDYLEEIEAFLDGISIA